MFRIIKLAPLVLMAWRWYKGKGASAAPRAGLPRR